MLIAPQEIRLGEQHPSVSSSFSSSSKNSNPSSSRLQEQFLESQQQQLGDLNDLTSSYDTIELLKQSLRQLSSLTKQQAAVEQAAGNNRICTGNATEEANNTNEGNSSNNTIPKNEMENVEEPIQTRLVASRSKTFSRRSSFSSQLSVGSLASSKSVRFGNVSILTAQELAQQISITTVDDFERKSTARKKETAQKKQQQKDESAVLDEYVKMAQSTRRRRTADDDSSSSSTKQLTRTHSSSALSHTEDCKASMFSLFRSKKSQTEEESLNAALQAAKNVTLMGVERSGVGENASVASSSKVKPRNSGFVKTMLSKTFGRRNSKSRRSMKNHHSNENNDISEVTMDDNVTETSSNEDVAAIVIKEIQYRQQRERSLDQAPDARGVMRRNSGASSVSSRSSGMVQKAARLLTRRSLNSSDLSSLASSSSTTTAEMGHPDYIPPQNIAFEEIITVQRSSSVAVHPDTAQLHDEIANLKQQLRGLVMEHMEECEIRKEQKKQRKHSGVVLQPRTVASSREEAQQ